MSRVQELFGKAEREFGHALHETALAAFSLLGQARAIHRVAQEYQEGRLDDDQALMLVAFVQVANHIGGVYTSAQPLIILWTPQATKGWRPAIRSGTAGIDGARYKIRAILTKHREYMNTNPFMEAQMLLQQAAGRFEAVEAALQEMIDITQFEGGQAGETTVAQLSVSQPAPETGRWAPLLAWLSKHIWRR